MSRARSGGPARPRILVVGWGLGAELERAIVRGSDRFDYTVLSMVLGAELRPLVRWHRMPWLPVTSYRLNWLAFFALGAVRVARIRADLVHCIGPTPIVPNRVDLITVTFCHAAFDAATAHRRLKGSSARFGWRLGQRLALALERWWFRRARVLAGLSDGAAADLRRHYPDAAVVVTPLQVDVGRFRPDDDARRRLRADEGVEDAAVVAVFVDQEHRPLKGLDVAIEGFAAAVRSGRGPDFLLVVGAGTERGAGTAERLGVGERVRFLGYRTDVERVLQTADIFVLPTAYETFCRAAHEAAACGLPVVAPPVAGIRELVGRDEAGILVDRDAGDVAGALMRLAGDAALRARMGQVGRSRAMAFEGERAAARIVDEHERLLAPR